MFIDSDGTTIYESRAICRYIALKHNKNNPAFYPTHDPKHFGLVEQWCSVEASNFDPSISGITVEGFFKTVFYKQTLDQAAVDAHRAKAGPMLDIYEAHLAKQKFLTGNHVTMADIFHIPYAFYSYKNTPNADLFEARPHVAAWLNGLFTTAHATKILAWINWDQTHEVSWINSSLLFLIFYTIRWKIN